MIEGNEYIRADDLLRTIDSYEVYKHYLGYTPHIKKLYLSPFRPDSNPSFGLFMGNDGSVLYKDFGDDQYKGNCIKFVQQLFGLNYRSAINKIVKDINREITPIIASYRPPEATRIQIIHRPFNSDDRAYWGDYGITTDELRKENVYSVKSLFINKSMIGIDNLCFAYLFEDESGEYLKIYQPYGKNKWLSNVPVKRPFGLDKLEKKSNIITIAKSKKDKIVLKKLITDVYETQKEGTEVITDDIDDYFERNYTSKFCFFDNDEPGKRANIGLNPRGYKWVNVPNSYTAEGIKDPSDLVKAYGYGRLEELLKEKGLL